MKKRKPQPNLVKSGLRYVIARNKWTAMYLVGKVHAGLIKPEKVLHLTRDEALIKRNKMRPIHHSVYQVFEVPYREEEKTHLGYVNHDV